MFSKKIYNKEDMSKYIAYLIYTRNINDFEKAKNEAAKYCGDILLPSNSDIKKELNYLALLHGYSSYDDQVNFIRETSFNLMLSLFSFSPHLIGGAAKGVVGLNSKIEINIFSINNKEYISNILEANNDIFIKNEFNKLNYCGQYSDIITFEDFDSSQDFEIFIYNDYDNFNNSLEYHYNWSIYKLAKVINKLNILNDFEEELKKDFKNE